ncbi:8c8d1baa-c2f7-4197-a215-999e0d2b459b [Sclerotinia trifoliorum]|uniref:8c8d1baa-c2f7-4197-a215-999e0d2b459b n=1 Tax=Sclerotinia trifoliorum TaxID=28548 RepID=A0A8H2VLI9_9HELO|nr:8c8d1baa-c2f7-4197-a215-999e0d2b459b [Sclerotinia trifoliorum]
MATNNQIIRYQDDRPNNQNQYDAQNQYNNASASQTPEVSYYSAPYLHQYQIDRSDRQYEQLAPPNPETPQNSRPNKSRYRSPPPELNKYASDRTTSSRGSHHDLGRPRHSWGKRDRARDIRRELERRTGKKVRKTEKQEIEREARHYERQKEESRRAPVDRRGESRGDADRRNYHGEKERSGRLHWRK